MGTARSPPATAAGFRRGTFVICPLESNCRKNAAVARRVVVPIAIVPVIRANPTRFEPSIWDTPTHCSLQAVSKRSVVGVACESARAGVDDGLTCRQNALRLGTKLNVVAVIKGLQIGEGSRTAAAVHAAFGRTETSVHAVDFGRSIDIWPWVQPIRIQRWTRCAVALARVRLRE